MLLVLWGGQNTSVRCYCNCTGFQLASTSTTRSQRSLTRFWRQAVQTTSDNQSTLHTFQTHMRSTNQLLLSKPITRTVISSRAFSWAASTIWNRLPHDIHVADSFARFRQSLHTHLYSLKFHWPSTWLSVTRRHTGTSSKTFNNNTNNTNWYTRSEKNTNHIHRNKTNHRNAIINRNKRLNLACCRDIKWCKES